MRLHQDLHVKTADQGHLLVSGGQTVDQGGILGKIKLPACIFLELAIIGEMIRPVYQPLIFFPERIDGQFKIFGHKGKLMMVIRPAVLGQGPGHQRIGKRIAGKIQKTRMADKIVVGQ